MSMRGSPRVSRGATVDARRFGWDRALVATLRHSSMPWDEPLPGIALTDVRVFGARDRLSLLGQFAAHQALLQFAGVADGELDPSEWAVVQKRGSDVRLLRVSARACDPTLAPPVLTIAQQFAELVGAELEILSQSWARADAIYAEAFARLQRDAAADLRWLRRAATGSIASRDPTRCAPSTAVSGGPRTTAQSRWSGTPGWTARFAPSSCGATHRWSAIPRSARGSTTAPPNRRSSRSVFWPRRPRVVMSSWLPSLRPSTKAPVRSSTFSRAAVTERG
jgi:hypothetical protein